jgi:hypothetical protein
VGASPIVPTVVSASIIGPIITAAIAAVVAVVLRRRLEQIVLTRPSRPQKVMPLRECDAIVISVVTTKPSHVRPSSETQSL